MHNFKCSFTAGDTVYEKPEPRRLKRELSDFSTLKSTFFSSWRSIVIDQLLSTNSYEDVDLFSVLRPRFPLLVVDLVHGWACDGDLGLGRAVLDPVPGHVEQTLQLVGVVRHVQDIIRAAGDRSVDGAVPHAEVSTVEHLEGRRDVGLIVIMVPTFQISLLTAKSFPQLFREFSVKFYLGQRIFIFKNTGSPILTNFTPAGVELPGLNISVDDVEGGDSVQTKGEQSLLDVEAESLHLMSEEGCQQVTEVGRVAVLVGVLLETGVPDELKPHVLVHQATNERSDSHQAVGVLMVDGFVLSFVNNCTNCCV